MKRRDFILASLSATGSLLPLAARGQAAPCPPPALQAGGAQVVTDCAVPSGAVPAWWADDIAHPVGTWRAYAGGSGYGAAEQNGLTLQNAGNAAGISVTSGVRGYSGASVEQSARRMLLMGGGHFDYSGNEVYALNLNQAVPAWEVFKPRSAGNSTTYSEGGNGTGQHSPDIGVNGHPCTSHTSNLLQCVDGRMWLGMMWGTAGATNHTYARFALNLSNRVWDFPTYGKVLDNTENSLIGGSSEGPACAVLTDRHEYFAGSYGSNTEGVRLFVLDTQTGAVKAKIKRGGVPTSVVGAKTTYPAGYGRGIGQGVAVGVPANGSRPAFVAGMVLPDSYMQPFTLLDPTALNVHYNPAYSNTSGLGVYSASTAQTNGSMLYCAAGDCIFYVHPPGNGGVCGRFVKIAIPAETTMDGLGAATWAWTLVQPSNWATPPTTVDTRVYGRFNIVQDMGNGRPAILYSPSTPVGGPVWILKLSASGGLS